MHLEHINMTVADLDRSINFYTRLLDLSIRWKGQTSNGLPAAHIGDDHCYLALFEARTPDPATPKDYELVGLNHFGIVVDDLDAMKVRLAELGIEVKSEQSYDPGRHAYFFDPDGLEVELVEYRSTENPAPQLVSTPEKALSK